MLLLEKSPGHPKLGVKLVPNATGVDAAERLKDEGV